jgi:subtilisin-like proprotein convertase family protein
MKFSSMWQWLGGRSRRGGSSRRRGRKVAGGPPRKYRPTLLNLEHLEDRTLLSVLPPPTVTGQVNVSATAGNSNTPSIAIDPTDPNKMAAVFTNHQVINGVDFIRIQAAYSNNGGQNWLSLGVPPNLIDPLSPATNPAPFFESTDASVGFDRDHNIYITYAEHSQGNTSGAIVLQKYDFSTAAAAQTITDEVIYSWANTDQAVKPAMAVDNNLPTFTSNGKTQSDPFSGTVYVAWGTVDVPPAPPPTPPTFNPNTIRLVSSSDGGSSFGAPQTVNDGVNFGFDRDGNPQLIVSQGTGDGRVQGGQVTLVWDDFGTGAPPTNPPFSQITTRSAPALESQTFKGTNGTINDAMAGTPNQPVTTTFTAQVNITDPNFTLSKLDVTLGLVSPTLDDLEIQLVAPDPSHTTVTLLRNRTNADGSSNGPGVGVTGQNMGISTSGIDLTGTVFDQDAARSITDTSAAAPFLGTFRPDTGGFPHPDLTVFNGMTAAELNGPWLLKITDFRNAGTTPPPQFVINWTLQMDSGGVPVAPASRVIAKPLILGAALSTYPTKVPASPSVGINSSPVIASDNTLGTFSPHEGRLYIAYVDHIRNLNSKGVDVNPAANTDIFLLTSDDGGITWTTNPIKVNDDNAATDGFSEAATDPLSGLPIGGRSQFDPSIAVDQSTGTVVLSFLDARNDAANARVATYVAASMDGGQTFAPEVYANAAQTVTDAITGKPVVVGPIPDNQSAGNSAADTEFDFGNHQGLAVAFGHVFPIWASNENGGPLQPPNNGKPPPLGIITAPTLIGAGPRVISSDMGPVNSGVFTNTGVQEVTGIKVQFDRPVNISSFGTNEVTVIYRNVTTPATQPGAKVTVSKITPLDADPTNTEATTFFVNFTTPQSGVGTYSYTIGPDIHNDIPSVVFGLTPDLSQSFNSTINNQPIPDATGLNVPGELDNSINATGFAPTAQVRSLTVTVNINHTFDPDLQLWLVAPDGVTRVALALNEGFGALSTANYTGTTFDDTAATSIADGSPPFTGTFRPEQPLAKMLGQSANGNWTLQIFDDFPGNTGTLLNWSLTINSGIPGTVINPGTLMDQFGNAQTGNVYAVPRPLNGTPFQPPYDQNTLPIIVPGPHIVSTFVNGSPVTSDNLVLNSPNTAIDVVFDRDMNPATFSGAQVLRMMGPLGQITGPFAVTADPNPNYPRLINGKVTTNPDPDPSHPRTYKITFPIQNLSGTYTITLASTIQDTLGEALDTNLNAGLSVLRGADPNSGQTIQTVVNLGNTGAIAIGPQKTVNSTLAVTTPLVIKSLTAYVNITGNDPDLSAQLIAPNGTIIKLFTNVGKPVGQNFFQTVFDDTAVTPIQAGNAPFTGSFNPQQPLEVLAGTSTLGTWTLQITNISTTKTAFLNATQGGQSGWGLTFTSVVPGTGLGEPVADQATASFRLFTMDPTNPLSHVVWTPVGPASENSGGNSGRVTGLAVDPSDPSGNTVYAGGASGGIWKTTNFLTTNPQGPTWIPLTNFGPTFAMNTGGIAVFGVNNDPNQSVVFDLTGEGDTQSRGVGFLRSMDGGATWQLLDSTTNVDGSGNPLPINSPSRDHKFVGNNGFKVLVDPTRAPGGGIIVYAAMSGPNGGIWRSLDSGNHWQLMRAGPATDIAFAYDSTSSPTNDIQVLYAGFFGDGVYITPNQGQTWTLMAGTTGDPLIQDDISGAPVKVAAPPSTPNGAKGRISLATPALTGNPLLDKQYEGYLYALVATTAGAMDGLYVTKDFGQNWTKIALAEASGPPTGNPLSPGAGIPSNNVKLPSASVIGSVLAPQGNYNQTVAIDPTNPDIVYVGGTDDFQPQPQGGFVRVDITNLHDPHALVPYDNQQADGGKLEYQTDPTAAAARIDPTQFSFLDSTLLNYTNLIRDPNNPFLSNATIKTHNYAQFNNDGSQALWIPFNDITQGSTDQHRLITMVDPVTGHARLILADDQGIYTGVDNGGTLDTGIGTATATTGSRSGNLQIVQFYDSASQPSVLAAEIADALLYGNAQDDGQPQSDPNLLQNGNIGWTGPTGDGTGTATDQTGTGTVYHYNWPCCGGNVTDFFQVTLPGAKPIGRTFGLLQQSNPPPTVDPQWPFTGGFKFAVNPINGDQIVISSAVGRVFRTQDQGVTWFPIGDPTNLDSTNAQALAYGAPLTNQIGNSDNFIYAGTVGGHIFVTFTGGGNGGGNAWVPLSNGLDGSAVQQIVTDPVPGSHDAYAVTLKGVYFMPDSTVAGAKWQNITGNVFSITEPVFGKSSDQLPALSYLTSIQADWRFAIPGNPNTHPVLYVGGEGGVFRSTNQGALWTLFPATTDGAPVNGGYLPLAHVTSLSLVLGNINSTTGLPDQTTGPDMLVAGTYGRGDYAIRLANNLAPGVHVTSLTVINSGTIQITFSGAVDPSSFTLADINSFRGPSGQVLSVNAVTDVTQVPPLKPNFHNVWQISFAPQTQQGVYTIALGPNITDWPGDKMDQNLNGINGESPGDTYTGRFYINPKTGANGPFVAGFFGQIQGTGAIYTATTNGTSGLSTTLWSGNAPVNLVDVVSGNFTGDGLTDIAGMDPNTGIWYVGVSNGSSFTFSPWTQWGVAGGINWVDIRTGDFNGDGKTDIIGRWQQTGQWWVNVSNGNSFTPSLWATWSADPSVTWTDVLAGDFTGDGKTDIAGRWLQTGQWYVGTSTGGAFSTSLWATWSADPGVTWADVQAADFNHDGKMDIVGRWLQTGQWYVGLSSGGSFNTTLWATWSPNVTWADVHVGDFNGDGNADIVGRVLQSGAWYVGLSNGSSAFNTSSTPWTAWSPAVTWADVMVGDFNGDGKTDIIGRVLQSGAWYAGISNGSSFMTSLWETWSSAVTWSHVMEMLNT